MQRCISWLVTTLALSVAGYAMLWRLPEMIDAANSLSAMQLALGLLLAMAWVLASKTPASKKVAAVLVVVVASGKYQLDIALPEPTAVDLTGRVAIVTGGNSGVGLASCKKLVTMGASVVIACRSAKKCQEALAEVGAFLKPGSNAQIVTGSLDLSSFESVRQFAEWTKSKFERVHILINNAGFAQAPPGALTKEGFELGLGSMHFGHFLLTNLLKDALESGSKDICDRSSTSTAISPSCSHGLQFARVLNVASHGSQVADTLGSGFHSSLFEGDGEGDLRGELLDSASFAMYCRSKLSNVLFTRQIAERWAEKEGIVSCSMHVGAVATNIWNFELLVIPEFLVNAWSGLFFRTPEQGSRTIMRCLLDPAQKVNGRYLNGMGQVVPDTHLAPSSRNDVLARRLWEVSERVCLKT